MKDGGASDMPPIRCEVPAHGTGRRWASDNVTSFAALSLADCQDGSNAATAHHGAGADLKLMPKTLKSWRSLGPR